VSSSEASLEADVEANAAGQAADLDATELMAIDGRRLGSRAQATRRRLLDATARLLETEGILDLKVVDVARKVGTSPATFYQYFANVEEAVLALSDEVGEEILALIPLLERPWRGPKALDWARQLVDGFIAQWDTNRAVLRTRNLAAQEGDRRFRDVRNKSLSNVTDRLAQQIADNRDAGRLPAEINPYAAAGAMVAMMERMAAYHFELEGRGVSRPDMVETVARILHQTVTGKRA
jgi:AcrR family transcriptional regulator